MKILSFLRNLCFNSLQTNTIQVASEISYLQEMRKVITKPTIQMNLIQNNITERSIRHLATLSLIQILILKSLSLTGEPMVQPS